LFDDQTKNRSVIERRGVSRRQMMKKVGFIGLGYLGKAIAKRLISEGVELAVWNRTAQKALDLRADIAAKPAEVALKADIIFLSLFDSAAVREVLSGKNGMFEADAGDKLIIDTSTNHFSEVLTFHDACSRRGWQYVEAPVLGSVIPASQGNLVVLVSGARDAYDNALPYLEKIGKTVFFLGEPALATKMKLINNLILGNFMAVIAEATLMGERSGFAKETVLEILSAGAGNSGVMNAKKQKILNDDFETHFSAALIYKDLHYLQDLAKTLRTPLFTGSVTKELFGMTFKDGNDALDMSVIYKVLKG
jgi:3-hydroxyisobutyrate dehydrogenase